MKTKGARFGFLLFWTLMFSACAVRNETQISKHSEAQHTQTSQRRDSMETTQQATRSTENEEEEQSRSHEITQVTKTDTTAKRVLHFAPGTTLKEIESGAAQVDSIREEKRQTTQKTSNVRAMDTKSQIKKTEKQTQQASAVHVYTQQDSTHDREEATHEERRRSRRFSLGGWVMLGSALALFFLIRFLLKKFPTWIKLP